MKKSSKTRYSSQPRASNVTNAVEAELPPSVECSKFIKDCGKSQKPLNIAVVVHSENNGDYLDELMEQSPHCYTKYRISDSRDSDALYACIASRGYDAIVGARFTYEIESWMNVSGTSLKTAQSIPLFATTATGVLNLTPEQSNKLYRMSPTDDRSLPGLMARLAFDYPDVSA